MRTPIFYACDKTYLIPTTTASLPISTYSRLLIPYFAPENNVAVYLDSDLVVLDDITKLLESNTCSNGLGAVPERPLKSSLKIAGKLGISPDCYFNAGVLVVNIPYWIKHKISDKCFQFILENPSKLTHLDQDALNVIFENNKCIIPSRWNLLPRDIRHYLESQDMQNEQKTDHIFKPAIVHFAGKNKPWNPYCNHPYKSIYLKYAAIAGYKVASMDFNIKSELLEFIKNPFNFRISKIIRMEKLKSNARKLI
jgi:lipopolysaccharide biosynthesis glycosyltransferase